jgi:hypothetical protein
VGINPRVSVAQIATDPPLPKMLEPGAPAYVVRAELATVKRYFLEAPPSWAWVEDTAGHITWAQVPAPILVAIRNTKRLRAVPSPYGGFEEVPIEDDEPLEGEDWHEPGEPRIMPHE